jgi:transcriptional regulator with XRE-family HTH domain
MSEELRARIRAAIAPEEELPRIPGYKFRGPRLRAGLSLGQMARLVGVSRATYANWEQGTHQPSRANRARSADVVRILLEELAARDDPGTEPDTETIGP